MSKVVKHKIIIFIGILFFSTSVFAENINLKCFDKKNEEEHILIKINLKKNFADLTIPIYLEDTFLSLKAIGFDLNDFTKTKINEVSDSFIDLKFYGNIKQGLDKFRSLDKPESMKEKFKNFETTFQLILDTNMLKLDDEGYANFFDILIYRDSLNAVFTSSVYGEFESFKFICELRKNQI